MLAGVIVAATGPQDFPAAIGKTAAALGTQAKERFAADPDLLRECSYLYQNTYQTSLYMRSRTITDVNLEVLAFFLARETVTRSVQYVGRHRRIPWGRDTPCLRHIGEMESV